MKAYVHFPALRKVESGLQNRSGKQGLKSTERWSKLSTVLSESGTCFTNYWVVTAACNFSCVLSVTPFQDYFVIEKRTVSLMALIYRLQDLSLLAFSTIFCDLGKVENIHDQNIKFVFAWRHGNRVNNGMRKSSCKNTPQYFRSCCLRLGRIIQRNQ